MSAQVHNYSFSNIGRMFARQNVPAIYGQQKAAEGAEPEVEAQALDSVSISPMAPKPLPAGLLQDALEAGRTIAAGGKISESSQTRLREDRIFNAISALSLMGSDGTLPDRWPGGIPAPTQEEMETARRRLSQRLRSDENVQATRELQQARIGLLERIGRRSFTAGAAAGTETPGEEIQATAASN